MEDWVFVDTCMWASYFGKRGSAVSDAIKELLISDRAAILGAVVAETIMGFRRKDQADWVASRLRSAHYVEAGWDDWCAAGELGRSLAARGHRLPLTDLLLAVVAQRYGASVYSSDPHFDPIPDARRYRPR
jgi:predicted nucleic acid-binding protein